MTGSAFGTISFKVTARVGRGDQVMVGGDAALLGRWDPRCAVPLYTTPADYPLWLSKDLPRPPGKNTVYRYCIFRGGRFLRWEEVSQPRVIRANQNRRLQLPRDVLDCDPWDESNSSDHGRHNQGTEDIRTNFASRTSHNLGEIRSHLDFGLESERLCQLNEQEQTVVEEQTLKGASCSPSTKLNQGFSEKGLTVPPVSTAVPAEDFEYPHPASTGAVEGGRAEVNPVEQDEELKDGLPPLDTTLNPTVLTSPLSYEEEEGEGGGLGLGFRLGVEAVSPPPPRMDKSLKNMPRPWSPRAGSVVVASFYLPVTLTKQAGQNGRDRWVARWDYEQLVALQSKHRVVRIGTLKTEERIEEHEKPAVAEALWMLNCVPVFLSESVAHQCYYQYCKGVLWPVLHDVLEVYDNLPNSLLDDKAITEGWQAYKNVNRAFRDKVVEVFNEGDMIWVHGFHLAILPAFLDRTVKVARIGLFLHTPFPPSEIFRALPHREELLRGMLGADQVGFHRVVDSRHFMSSCRRILGLRHVYTPEAGLVQIVHGGKAVILTNRHAGVDPQAVRSALSEQRVKQEVAKIRRLHADRMVIGGVEMVERVKGVWLKLLAFESMLLRYPDLVGRVSMHEVGISNPVRGSDFRACQKQISELVRRLNTEYGEGTVVYEERNISDATLLHRVALMSECSVFVKTPVHDGLSTAPIEFRIVQQLKREDEAFASGSAPSIPAALIMSSEVSCVQALKGGFIVNSWKVDAVGDAMAAALRADDSKRIAWHEDSRVWPLLIPWAFGQHQADVEWCQSNTTAAWAEDVLGVLSTVQKENRTRYATTGLGLRSRVVGTDPSFKKLDTSAVRMAYSSSTSRVFFLDFGGTLVKDDKQRCAGGTAAESRMRFSHPSKLVPSRAVLEGLEGLCSDPKNLVFVVSGRCKQELQEAFGHIKGLGLAAEHGSFFRWPSSRAYHSREADVSETGKEVADKWRALHPGVVDTSLKKVVRRFMEDFQMNTHGSYIEEKGTAMIWHYGDADPEFGALQAKQLQDELTDVLGSSAGSNSTVDAIVDTSGRAIGGAAVLGVEGVESSALSCSSHSSSAVSENRCGGMVIIHDDGRNSNASEGGAYVEVRARGVSKGNFVHMVLSRLGWSSEDSGSDVGTFGGGRFCLCVGDDVSDEDMFLAVKSYEGVCSGGDCTGGGEAMPMLPMFSTSSTLVQQSNIKKVSTLLTVTVGCKPSDADAWVPSVGAVVSLLRSLVRVPRRRNTAQTHLSKLSVASGSMSPVHSNMGVSVSVGMGMDRAVAQSNPGGNAIEQICQQAEMVDVGEGVPVVRRHSYCLGGKQRISSSLAEFLRGVAQPEPEPLMF